MPATSPPPSVSTTLPILGTSDKWTHMLSVLSSVACYTSPVCKVHPWGRACFPQEILRGHTIWKDNSGEVPGVMRLNSLDEAVRASPAQENQTRNSTQALRVAAESPWGQQGLESAQKGRTAYRRSKNLKTAFVQWQQHSSWQCGENVTYSRTRARGATAGRSHTRLAFLTPRAGFVGGSHVLTWERTSFSGLTCSQTHFCLSSVIGGGLKRVP